MKRKKRQRRDPDRVFHESVGRYLKRHGYVALVTGPMRVIDPSPLETKRFGLHELVIHFTGAKVK